MSLRSSHVVLKYGDLGQENRLRCSQRPNLFQNPSIKGETACIGATPGLSVMFVPLVKPNKAFTTDITLKLAFI